MPEVEIKRTNFFDGQFLKEGEFKDMDLYHVHMRRRWAFVMFNQSGVVQAGASDLTVHVPNPANKILLVRAGMAIGKNPNDVEAKEVVLRNDTPPIDLTLTSVEVPTPIAAGQTGFVTVHYLEQPVPTPPSEGDVAGNTRVLEHARITVHNAVPPPSAPNGEPYIRLGDVTFNSMAVSTANRQQAFFNAALLATPPQITVSPATVPATGTAVLTVTSSGGMNLTGPVTVVIAPNTGITHVVSNQTVNSLTLTLTLTGAGTGLHNLTITTNATASTTFSVAAVIPAPTFISLTPSAATGNTKLTIAGTNFIAPVTVIFNNGGAVIGPTFTGLDESLSPTQITFRVPGSASSAGTGTLTINAAGGSVLTSTFVRF